MKSILKQFALFGFGLMVFTTAHAQVSSSLSVANLVDGALTSTQQGKTQIEPSTKVKKGKSGKKLAVSSSNHDRGNASANTLRVNNSPDSEFPEFGGSASIYRVGSNDVLDIRLSGMESRESTLFTVSSDGKLDYPLIGNPVSVCGLTPDEIAARISSEVTIYSKPAVEVTVREYASHFVIVTGAVANPGSKILSREAVPLYALLSEAEPT